MKNFMINGRERLCYVVKEGIKSDIVIPYDNVLMVDRMRLSAMESQGGELLKTMSKERLDNGVNALVAYQNVFVTVTKTVPAKKPETLIETANLDGNIPVPAEATKPKRRAGRPKGAKNKSKPTE